MSISPDTDPALETLQRFLGKFDLAAVAHARVELTTEERARLQDFANGELSADARAEIVSMLAHNTTALEYLAELLKEGGSGNEKS